MTENFKLVFTSEGDLFILHPLKEDTTKALGYLVHAGELCSPVFGEFSESGLDVQYLTANNVEEALWHPHKVTHVDELELVCQRSVHSASARLFNKLGGLRFGGRVNFVILKPVLVAEEEY